jgi:hypothetical protein
MVADIKVECVITLSYIILNRNPVIVFFQITVQECGLLHRTGQNLEII